MLRNTFCHVPGIGVRTECRLWASGLHSWDDLVDSTSPRLARLQGKPIKEVIGESIRELENHNPHYFLNALPQNELWRIFPDFRDSVAYLDIETTGMNEWENHITTITLYNGKDISCYVYGRNLDEFERDIENYNLVITYSGRSFDVPFIESSLQIRMKHVHIDLRYLLKSLGYMGGLKGCEKKLGLDRGELDGVNGYYAVLLWNEFVRYKNEKALETLLAYNILDTVNLEALMVMAYNLKLKTTPFFEANQLPLPDPPELPFSADLKTLERIRMRMWSERAC